MNDIHPYFSLLVCQMDMWTHFTFMCKMDNWTHLTFLCQMDNWTHLTFLCEMYNWTHLTFVYQMDNQTLLTFLCEMDNRTQPTFVYQMDNQTHQSGSCSVGQWQAPRTQSHHGSLKASHGHQRCTLVYHCPNWNITISNSLRGISLFIHDSWFMSRMKYILNDLYWSWALDKKNMISRHP